MMVSEAEGWRSTDVYQMVRHEHSGRALELLCTSSYICVLSSDSMNSEVIQTFL